MNKAIETLYNEHDIIISAVGITGSLKALREQNPEAYEAKVRELIVFLRGFADEFHHYKEEIGLFPEMSKKHEMLEGGILREMFDNHEEFREMLRNIESRLDHKEYEKAQKQLETYVNMLLDHIAVENDEVFQIAETLFNESELENIGFRFQDVDREIGEEKKIVLLKLADEIEKING